MYNNINNTEFLTIYNIYLLLEEEHIMSPADQKLERLKQYLGEKKLKQLGLISCNTCLRIFEQASSFSVPHDMDENTYLTADDMNEINAALSESVSDLIESSNKQVSEPTPEELLTEAANAESTQQVSDTSNEVIEDPQKIASESPATSEDPKCLTFTIGHNDMLDESAFLKKLTTILQSTTPINKADLGMGYLYNYPNIPLPHSLCCSECGRLFAIAHPTLELLPLPVYLTDTEYEMIKGIYVDTLL